MKSRWGGGDRRSSPSANGDGPCGLRVHQCPEQLFSPPTLQSQPGTPTSPAPSPRLSGTRVLLPTSRIQPGPPRGAESKGRATEQVLLGAGLEPTGLPHGPGLARGPGGRSEQTHTSEAHVGCSARTQECSFAIDIEKRLHGNVQRARLQRHRERVWFCPYSALVSESAGKQESLAPQCRGGHRGTGG